MQPRHIGGRSRGRTALTVILSLLAVLLAVFCILSWMLFSDPNAGVSLPKPSDTAVSKVAAASISGRETALTPEEVGGWLNGLLQDNAETSSRMGVSALSVTAGKDSTANVYFPVKYKGKRFGVLVNLAPSFDSTSEEMKFAVRSVKVGRLPIPVSTALNFAEKRLPSILSRQGNTLVCSTKSLFLVPVSGISAQLKMTSLRMQDGIFYTKFMPSVRQTG